MADQLHRLLARRDELAEASTKALAHWAPDADELGEYLGDVETAIETADVATFDRLLGGWLEHDQARLQAHLTGEASDCVPCSRIRRPARAS